MLSRLMNSLKLFHQVWVWKLPFNKITRFLWLTFVVRYFISLLKQKNLVLRYLNYNFIIIYGILTIILHKRAISVFVISVAVTFRKRIEIVFIFQSLVLFYEFYLLSTHCQRITWAGGLTRTPAASSENQHRVSFLLFAFICFAKSSFFGWLSSHWVRMLGRGLVGGVQFPELTGAVAVWCRVLVRCRLLCGFAWRQSDCPKVSPWCTIATVCRG